MILAIDIGNTQTTLGAIEGDAVVCDWRLSTRAPRTSDELAVTIDACFTLDGIHREQIEEVVIGSVVAHLTSQFEQACLKLMDRRVLVVDGRTPMPVANGYRAPEAVGVDRLANAVAGSKRFGTPLIVVDFGTATTFDVISAKGVYEGGAIMPGPDLMADALFSGTSRLPRVAIGKPESAIGRTTLESLQSGIFYSIAGGVDSLIDRIRAELKAPSCKAVATGGLGRLFFGHCATISAYEPFLTLFGLAEIWQFQKNRP